MSKSKWILVNVWVFELELFFISLLRKFGRASIEAELLAALPCLLLLFSGGLNGMGSLWNDRTCQQIASLLAQRPRTMPCHMPIGGVMGGGMNGSHFHVLPSKPDPPKTARLQSLCYHHTHTQKALSGGCLGQWCDTDIRADTSAISQNKTSRDSFQIAGGPEERHCLCWSFCSCSQQSHQSHTYCTNTFPTH